MEATPVVTVITAFLNEERFLEEAIESVLGQQFDNWEMILIDDGSTDNSTAIARRYAALYPGKIIYTEHEGHANKSTAASRNLGIAKARGELVAFLDADDVWNPAKLRIQVNIMRDHPGAAMLLEASEYWNSWQNTGKQDIVVQVGKIRDRLFQAPALAETLYPLVPVAAPCPSAIMVRREALLKHGGFEAGFTGKYQLYEDQAFLIKFYLNEPVYISSQCNNRYRQRIGSCVQWVRKEGSYHVVRKYFLQWLQQYMLSHHITHKNVQRLFNRAREEYSRPVLHFFRKGLMKVQQTIMKV
ncbi:glycosyltransferase family A protein [Paraflavitalea sp. CAU 1676]|uniref:glycosyltransferase family 2 protein n=1 Tax=Paraflavitalea sp. CAU 1676 TaxID=3032598 RepID=UPI0023DC50A1|nr:glycosyltransferase family A protein [Paraflavitalea sp. CAU 1676]MDF2188469.1 glycosyltransferase family A protein [Paraflavitalea sp. CAU 1676]